MVPNPNSLFLSAKNAMLINPAEIGLISPAITTVNNKKYNKLVPDINSGFMLVSDVNISENP